MTQSMRITHMILTIKVKKKYTHRHTYTQTYTYIHAFEPQLLCSDQPCKFRTDMFMICLCVLCVLSLNHVSLQPHGLCPSGSSGHGIFQARILEWVAICSSGRSSWPKHRTWVSCTAGVFFTSESPEKPMICYMLSHFSHVQFCDPMDYSLPGSSVYRIFQARILEWIAICIHKCLLNEKINICYNFKQ